MTRPWLTLGLRWAELAGASGYVIAYRSALLAAGMADAELALMVPEKLDALGRASAAAAASWWQLQLDLATGALAPAAGRRIVDRMAGIAGAALTPWHRGATANARRLARQRWR